jgi:hypothetical protein
MKRIVLRLVLAVVLVGLVVAGLAWRYSSHPPAPAAAQAPAAVSSGSYADDWQAQCAPITGPTQLDCTRRLDSAYGRTADAPVPPAK